MEYYWVGICRRSKQGATVPIQSCKWWRFTPLSAVISSFPWQAPSPAKPLTTWTIKATSSYGALITQFTPSAGKMKIEKLGINVLTKAPNWEAFIYSTETKKYFEIPYEQIPNKFS